MACNIVTSLLIISAIAVSITSVYGFPTGAPVDVCPDGIPRHGKHGPQPLSSNPYHITASDTKYSPGKQIRVTVSGADFRGFFIQAKDAKTNNWVGTFSDTENSQIHAECSAVTHVDAKDKQQATLIWNAPSEGEGEVYFTGSVVKDFATFWINLRSHSQ